MQAVGRIGRLRGGRGLALFASAGAVVLIDQLTKWLVRATLSVGESLPIVPGLVWLTHVSNTGAAFGLMPGSRGVLVTVSLLVVASVAFYWSRYKPQRRRVAFALGLIVGGALGNLIDRIVAGTVTDFLDVRVFPVFNVADSGIVIGTTLLAVLILLAPADSDAAGGEARDVTSP
jgi:signal peptidase II